MTRPLRRGGFSLLEVLVAMAITSAVVGLLLQIFGVGLRNAALSAEYSRAALHAQSLLDRLGVDIDLGEDGVRGGELSDGTRWAIALTPLVLPLPPDLIESARGELLRVELTVYWGDRDNPRELSVTTARLVKKPEE